MSSEAYYRYTGAQGERKRGFHNISNESNHLSSSNEWGDETDRVKRSRFVDEAMRSDDVFAHLPPRPAMPSILALDLLPPLPNRWPAGATLNKFNEVSASLAPASSVLLPLPEFPVRLSWPPPGSAQRPQAQLARAGEAAAASSSSFPRFVPPAASSRTPAAPASGRSAVKASKPGATPKAPKDAAPAEEPLSKALVDKAIKTFHFLLEKARSVSEKAKMREKQLQKAQEALAAATAAKTQADLQTVSALISSASGDASSAADAVDGADVSESAGSAPFTEAAYGAAAVSPTAGPVPASSATSLPVALKTAKRLHGVAELSAKISTGNAQALKALVLMVMEPLLGPEGDSAWAALEHAARLVACDGKSIDGPTFVVYTGRRPGVYMSKAAADAQLAGITVPGRVRRFGSIGAARLSFHEAVKNGNVVTPGLRAPSASVASSPHSAQEALAREVAAASLAATSLRPPSVLEGADYAAELAARIAAFDGARMSGQFHIVYVGRIPGVYACKEVAEAQIRGTAPPGRMKPVRGYEGAMFSLQNAVTTGQSAVAGDLAAAQEAAARAAAADGATASLTASSVPHAASPTLSSTVQPPPPGSAAPITVAPDSNLPQADEASPLLLRGELPLDRSMPGGDLELSARAALPVSISVYRGPGHVVYIGRRPGIYLSLAAAVAQTIGIANGRMKSIGVFRTALHSFETYVAKGRALAVTDTVASTEAPAAAVAAGTVSSGAQVSSLAPWKDPREDSPAVALEHAARAALPLGVASASPVYVVYSGRVPGVYVSKHAALLQLVHPTPAKAHRTFSSYSSALQSFQYARDSHKLEVLTDEGAGMIAPPSKAEMKRRAKAKAAAAASSSASNAPTGASAAQAASSAAPNASAPYSDPASTTVLVPAKLSKNQQKKLAKAKAAAAVEAASVAAKEAAYAASCAEACAAASSLPLPPLFSNDRTPVPSASRPSDGGFVPFSGNDASGDGYHPVAGGFSFDASAAEGRGFPAADGAHGYGVAAHGAMPGGAGVPGPHGYYGAMAENYPYDHEVGSYPREHEADTVGMRFPVPVPSSDASAGAVAYGMQFPDSNLHAAPSPGPPLS